MPKYDSDSSSDDGAEYTTTNVILGYATAESSGDDISHIGGHPTWLDDQRTPPASLAECKNCHGKLSLLLQLNADLQQYFPQDTRRIHIWYCKNKTCSRKPGSVRAIREVKKPVSIRKARPAEIQDVQKAPTIDLGNALFGGSKVSASGNINPFSTNTTPASNTNIFSGLAATSTLGAKPPQTPLSDVQPLTESFASKLKLNLEPPPNVGEGDTWPKQSDFPDPFPVFYLDAYPEELEPIESVNDATASSSKTKYDAEDSSSANVDKESSDMSIDKTFQKFSDIVSQNPEQVLRYEFKGQPLLYSGIDTVSTRFVVPHGKAGAVKGIPRCENCGAQRVFELQLAPYLIFEIEKDESMDIDDGMEWGTIIVGSCANNCGEEGVISFREEWAGVQWEERTAKK